MDMLFLAVLSICVWECECRHEQQYTCNSHSSRLYIAYATVYDGHSMTKPQQYGYLYWA